MSNNKTNKSYLFFYTKIQHTTISFQAIPGLSTYIHIVFSTFNRLQPLTYNLMMHILGVVRNLEHSEVVHCKPIGQIISKFELFSVFEFRLDALTLFSQLLGLRSSSICFLSYSVVSPMSRFISPIVIISFVSITII